MDSRDRSRTTVQMNREERALSARKRNGMRESYSDQLNVLWRRTFFDTDDRFSACKLWRVMKQIQ
jgi:hypothetical protein